MGTSISQHHFVPTLANTIADTTRISNRLDNCRSSIRFLAAPSGFGKTHCLFNYSRKYFTVCWIEGSSPRFIYQLYAYAALINQEEDFNLPDTFSIPDKAYKESVPFLKPPKAGRIHAFGNGIRTVPLTLFAKDKEIASYPLKRHEEVVVETNAYEFLNLRHEQLLIIDEFPVLCGAELKLVCSIIEVLSHAGVEMVFAGGVDAYSAYFAASENSSSKLSLRLFSAGDLAIYAADYKNWKSAFDLCWHTNEDFERLRAESNSIPGVFASNFLFNSESNENDNLMKKEIVSSILESAFEFQLSDKALSCAVAMLLFGEGTFEDLRDVGLIVDKNVLSELRSVSLVLGIDRTENVFRTIHVEPYEISNICSNAKEELEGQTQLPFEESLGKKNKFTFLLNIRALLDTLIKRGDVKRALEVLREFSSEDDFAYIGKNYGIDLLQNGEFMFVRSVLSRLSEETTANDFGLQFLSTLVILLDDGAKQSSAYSQALCDLSKTESEKALSSSLANCISFMRGNNCKEAISTPEFLDDNSNVGSIFGVFELLSMMLLGKRVARTLPIEDSQASFNLPMQIGVICGGSRFSYETKLIFALELFLSGRFIDAKLLLAQCCKTNNTFVSAVATYFKASVDMVLMAKEWAVFSKADDESHYVNLKAEVQKFKEKWSDSKLRLVHLGLHGLAEELSIFEGIAYMSWGFYKEATTALSNSKRAALASGNRLLCHVADLLFSLILAMEGDLSLASEVLESAHRYFRKTKHLGLEPLANLVRLCINAQKNGVSDRSVDMYIRNYSSMLSLGEKAGISILQAFGYMQRKANDDAEEELRDNEALLCFSESFFIANSIASTFFHSKPELLEMFMSHIDSEEYTNRKQALHVSYDKKAFDNNKVEAGERLDNEVYRIAQSSTSAKGTKKDKEEGVAQTNDAPVDAEKRLEKINVPEIKVRMFGSFEIEKNGSVLPANKINRRKSRQLFAAILLSESKGISREYISQQLWPNVSSESQRNGFYVAWANLRYALDCKKGDKSIIMVDRSTGLCRTRTDTISCDALELEALAKSLVVNSMSGETEDLIAICNKIEALYRGELLSGEDLVPDLQRQREKFHNLFVESMIKGASLAHGRGEYGLALWFARRAYTFETKREDVYIELMKAHVALSQHASAYSTFFECKNMLAEEYGTSPSQKMFALYEEINGLEEFERDKE